MVWWELTFDSNFTVIEISNSWAATLTTHGNGKYTFKGTYTGIIAPNSSVVLGFQAVKQGTPEIWNATLNEVVVSETTIFVANNAPPSPVLVYDNWLLYSVSGNSVIIHGFANNNYDPDLVIPNMIDGRIVSGIHAGAFADTRITSVTFPVSGITTIDDFAFANTTRLVNVIIPGSVTRIGKAAFADSGITSVVFAISDVPLTIGLATFAECVALTTITLPNRLNNLGDFAFSGAGLVSVDLGNGVRFISDGAFERTNLMSIEISANILSVGAGAFAETFITPQSQYIPESVDVHELAFGGETSSYDVLGATAATHNNDIQNGFAAEMLTLTPGSSHAERGVTWHSLERGIQGRVKLARRADMSGDRRDVFPALGDPRVRIFIDERPFVGSNDYEANARNARVQTYSGRMSHSVTLDNLIPDTEYVYAVSNDGGHFSVPYSFRTSANGDFTFVAVSDLHVTDESVSTEGRWLLDTNYRQNVTIAQAWQNTLRAIERTVPNVSFIASSGDQIDRHLAIGTPEEFLNEHQIKWQNFFGPNQMSRIPFAPTMGNHDARSNLSFYSHFNLPNEANFNNGNMRVETVAWGERDTIEWEQSFLELALPAYESGVPEGSMLLNDVEIPWKREELQSWIVMSQDSLTSALSKFESGEVKIQTENENRGHYFYLYNRALFVVLNTSAKIDSTNYNDGVVRATHDADVSAMIVQFDNVLTTAVATHDGDYDWLIVQTHKGVSGLSDHSADHDIERYVRMGLERLVIEHGVDVYLSGHDHCYARSYPARINNGVDCLLPCLGLCRMGGIDGNPYKCICEPCSAVVCEGCDTCENCEDCIGTNCVNCRECKVCRDCKNLFGTIEDGFQREDFRVNHVSYDSERAGRRISRTEGLNETVFFTLSSSTGQKFYPPYRADVRNSTFPYLSDGTTGRNRMRDNRISPWNIAAYHQNNRPVFLEVQVNETSLSIRTIEFYGSGNEILGKGSTRIVDTLIICAGKGVCSVSCVCICIVCDELDCTDDCCFVCKRGECICDCLCDDDCTPCKDYRRLGDVDGSGTVFVFDALEILRYLVNLSSVLVCRSNDCGSGCTVCVDECSDDCVVDCDNGWSAACGVKYAWSAAQIVGRFDDGFEPRNPIVQDALQILRWCVGLSAPELTIVWGTRWCTIG
jgi:hypothetical protein